MTGREGAGVMRYPVTKTLDPSGLTAIDRKLNTVLVAFSGAYPDFQTTAPVVALYATNSAMSSFPTPGSSSSPATKTADPSGLTAVASPNELRAGSKRAAHSRAPLVAPWTRVPPLLAAVAVPLVTACPP